MGFASSTNRLGSSAGGDEPSHASGVRVGRAHRLHHPEGHYDYLKHFMRPSLGSADAQRAAEEWLQTQELGSSQQAANAMRDFSRNIRIWNWESPDFRTPLQEECNHKLWTHNAPDANGHCSINHVVSNDVTRLFTEGNEKDWPQIILTSNHARAASSDDLTEVMEGITHTAGRAIGKELDRCALTSSTPAGEAAGKSIVIAACHTESDVFLNGANHIERRLALRNEVEPGEGKPVVPPSQRTREGISPAALRLAKLMLKCMVEPDSQRHIDLDRSEIDRPGLVEQPFVADHVALVSTGVTSPAKYPLVLRKDAASIAQHFTLAGFSKGAQTVSDARNFLLQEFDRARGCMGVRQRDGKIKKPDDRSIAEVMQNIDVLELSPGATPGAPGEGHRTILYNQNDLTVGHFLKRDVEAGKYTGQDRIIGVNGSRDHFGHGIVDALGNHQREGFFTDPARANDPNFAMAQDWLKTIFARQKHAIAVTDCKINPVGREDEAWAVNLKLATGAHSANPGLWIRLEEALQQQGWQVYHDVDPAGRKATLTVVRDPDYPPPVSEPQESLRHALHDFLSHDDGAHWTKQADGQSAVRGMVAAGKVGHAMQNQAAHNEYQSSGRA